MTSPDRVALLAAAHELDQWAAALELRHEGGRSIGVSRLANRLRRIATKLPPTTGGATDIDARKDQGQ